MPTFTRNTILVRIKDLVGDEVTDIEGYKDIINTGFNHVADLIPADSEIWRDDSLVVADVAGLPYVNKIKVIAITREDSNSVARTCVEVPFDYLQRGQDETSIYYNEGNYRNPIYSFSPGGELTVKPDNTDVLIYYYIYLTNEEIEGLLEGGSFGFPEQALYLGILKASSNLLQAKVSLAVQEEEDGELLSLLNGQMASIDKSMQEEMQRLGLPYKLVGDGNDIE